MFEMQSVLQEPATSKRQLAALAAFFHLTVATVLLLGLIWRIESVEPPNILERFLPVAFLPAEWSAPLQRPAKPPVPATPEKAPEIVQPRNLDDIAPIPPPVTDISGASDLDPAALTGEPGTAESLPGTGGIAPAGGIAAESATVVFRPDMVAPRILYRLDPRYPEAARVARRQGTVVVEAEIGTDGSLKSARVVSSPLGFGLEKSALDAIRAWRFAPASYGNRPVAVYYRWNIVFTLR